MANVLNTKMPSMEEAITEAILGSLQESVSEQDVTYESIIGFLKEISRAANIQESLSSKFILLMTDYPEYVLDKELPWISHPDRWQSLDSLEKKLIITVRKLIGHEE